MDEEPAVEQIAVNYFWDLFTTTSPSEIDEVLTEVPTLVSEQMNERLMDMAMEEEVQKALFMMHPKKASGLDGLTALFYQKAWRTIKKDLV